MSQGRKQQDHRVTKRGYQLPHRIRAAMNHNYAAHMSDEEALQRRRPSLAPVPWLLRPDCRTTITVADALPR
jgi:hypothetical protein